MHGRDIASLDEVGRPSVTDEERFQLLSANASQNGRVIDLCDVNVILSQCSAPYLVAVQVQYRQHRAVCDWVQKFGRVPARSKRAGLGLSVSNHGQGDQIWVIEDCAESVGDGVTKLSTLVQATRCLGRSMRSDSTRERERFEEAPHALLVFALVGIDLRVHSFKETV